MVFASGPRQLGKTTPAKPVLERQGPGVFFMVLRPPLVLAETAAGCAW
jgi:hypothetical protein